MNGLAILTRGLWTTGTASTIAAPIAQQILENIISTLQCIVAGASYKYTLAEVVMNDRMLSGFVTEFASYPSADVLSWDESKDEESEEGFSVNDLLVTIGAYTDERTSIDTALGYLAADIQKALKVDRTRGNLAEDTKVRRIQKIISSEIGGSATGLVDITLEIRYRHREANPYSQ
jgi:hypothetical protein